MKMEFHNAHGYQLILRLTEKQTVRMLSKVMSALVAAQSDGVNHYAKFDIEFENDNDRWEPTEFDIVVEVGEDNETCKEI